MLAAHGALMGWLIFVGIAVLWLWGVVNSNRARAVRVARNDYLRELAQQHKAVTEGQPPPRRRLDHPDSLAVQLAAAALDNSDDEQPAPYAAPAPPSLDAALRGTATVPAALPLTR